MQYLPAPKPPILGAISPVPPKLGAGAKPRKLFTSDLGLLYVEFLSVDSEII